MAINIIVVPDDAALGGDFRPLNVRALEQNMLIMAQDNLRMYVRETTWGALKQGYELTKRAEADRKAGR